MAFPVSALTTRTVGTGGGFDHATITDAINFANSATADDFLITVAPGNYTETLTLSGGNWLGMTIQGTGPGVIIDPAANAINVSRGGTSASNRLVFDNVTVAPTSAGARGFSFGTGGISYVTIENSTLTGPASSSAQGINIDGPGSGLNDIVIEDSTISGWRHGFRTASQSQVSNLTIDTVNFSSSLRSHIVKDGGASGAADPQNNDNWTIKDSTFGNITVPGSGYDAAMWLFGGDDDSMDNWSITGNTITTTLSTAAVPVNGSGNYGGIIFNARAGDTYFGLDILNNQIINNSGSTGNLLYGIKFNTVAGVPGFDVVTIEGNTFTNLQIGAFSSSNDFANLNDIKTNPTAGVDLGTLPLNTFNSMAQGNSFNLLVPEPASAGLLALGGMMMIARRRKNA